MNVNEIEKCCDTCEFNMPVKGKFICAGRTKEYGQETPIIGVDYNECWEISYFQYEECEDVPTFPYEQK